MKEEEVIGKSLESLDDIIGNICKVADNWDSDDMPDSWFADQRVCDISMLMNTLYLDANNLKNIIRELK